MARNGSGVYSLPPGSTVANGDTSDATDINTPLADIADDLNVVRPIVAGGTGASSASAARTALGVQAQNAGLQAIADASVTAVSGADPTVLTGTPGADGSLATWNTDGDLVDGGALASVDPKGLHTVFISGDAFKPRDTGGAAYASVELATNKIMTTGYDFDADTRKNIQFTMAMPKSWDEGTLSAQVLWRNAGAVGTGDVIWGVEILALGDGDAMDSAFGTAQTVTDTFQFGGNLHVTTATADITPSGTASEGDILIIQVYRDAADVSDTYDRDARFLGLVLKFTTNAANDS